jgi:hypothetical protein
MKTLRSDVTYLVGHFWRAMYYVIHFLFGEKYEAGYLTDVQMWVMYGNENRQ